MKPNIEIKYDNAKIHIKSIKFKGVTWENIDAIISSSENEFCNAYLKFPFPLYDSFNQDTYSFIWLNDDKLEELVLN